MFFRKRKKEAETPRRLDEDNAKRPMLCRCGKPGTHWRGGLGTVGPMPMFSSCEEHVNVNMWNRVAGGNWVPGREFSNKDLTWMTDAYPIEPPVDNV